MLQLVPRLRRNSPRVGIGLGRRPPPSPLRVLLLNERDRQRQSRSGGAKAVRRLAVREDLIGVPAETAARIASISRQRLLRWEAHRLVVPSVRREISPHNIVREYGFVQLVELLVVRELEDKGLNVRQVLTVVRAARNKRKVQHPLRELRWAVSAGQAYVQYPDGTWTRGWEPSQTVMADVLDLEAIRASVRNAIPKTRSKSEVGKVVKRRGVVASKPVFAGTRTPVASVQAYVKRGYSDRAILESLPHLSRADIREAKRLLGAA